MPYHIFEGILHPSSVYGGQYELFDKHLADGRNQVTFTANTTNTGVYDIASVLSNNTFVITLYMTTKVQMSDSDVEYGTVNLSNYCSGGHMTQYITGYSDGGNSVWMAALVNSSSNILVKSIDVVGTKPIAANVKLSLTFTVSIPFEYRKDSACDKFYWRRVSN